MSILEARTMLFRCVVPYTAHPQSQNQRSPSVPKGPFGSRGRMGMILVVPVVTWTQNKTTKQGNARSKCEMTESFKDMLEGLLHIDSKDQPDHYSVCYHPRTPKLNPTPKSSEKHKHGGTAALKSDPKWQLC